MGNKQRWSATPYDEQRDSQRYVYIVARTMYMNNIWKVFVEVGGLLY